MPNRLLNSRLHISNSIRMLTPLEEVVFIHIILSCDDFGRFYADPDILRGQLFPGRNISVKQVEDSLAKLEEQDMVIRYSCEGLMYLQLVNWLKYQKPRAKESKYPNPPAHADKVPPEPPESEESEQPEDPQKSTPEFISIILNDGSLYPVTVAAVERYEKLYPSVDVRQELRNMVGWSESNPTKRKTKNGIARFITSWLSRKQDSGGTNGIQPRKPSVVEPKAGENPFKKFSGGM